MKCKTCRVCGHDDVFHIDPGDGTAWCTECYALYAEGRRKIDRSGHDYHAPIPEEGADA